MPENGICMLPETPRRGWSHWSQDKAIPLKDSSASLRLILTSTRSTSCKGIMRLHLMTSIRLVGASQRACQWFLKDLEIRSINIGGLIFGQTVYTLAWIDCWLPRHQGLRTTPFNLRQQLSHKNQWLDTVRLFHGQKLCVSIIYPTRII